MACDGSTKKCEIIANETYPTLQGKIDDSLIKISADIRKISGDLSSISVPDDYLGAKVKKELDELIINFDADADLSDSEIGTVDSFIDKQITEHKRHRSEYLKAEEQKRLALIEAQKAQKEKEKEEGNSNIKEAHKID